MVPFTWRGSTYKDHKNLEYFTSAWVLNWRQVRWSMSLSRFDFVITYWLGTLRRKLDALSRRSYLVLKEGDPILDHQKSIVLKPINFHLKSLAKSSSEDASFLKEVKRHYRMIHLLKTLGNGYVPMKSMMNLNSRMDSFISRNTFRALTPQNNSNAPQFICSWTFWLQQNHGVDIMRFLVAMNAGLSIVGTWKISF